jgi:hypothetical protein
VNALRTLGYEAVWQGERSWNGVAILARNHIPVLTCTSLPRNPEDRYSEHRYPEDRQARYIEAAVQGVLITSIYLPNGNPQPGPKFNYKLAWFERLIAHAAELMASGAPVVLAGDYIRTGRSGHSGITNSNAGRRTKACDSITFCSHRICRSASWTPALTDGRVGRKTRATTRQHGSCLISRPESRFQPAFFGLTAPSSVNDQYGYRSDALNRYE